MLVWDIQISMADDYTNSPIASLYPLPSDEFITQLATKKTLLMVMVKYQYICH